MNMNNTFDLIVMGTGTAASTAAHECRSAGWNVAIIDSLPFGGTCALRGCDPKKVLVEAAKVIDSTQRHENKGIVGSEGIRIRWSDLMSFKRTFTEPRPKLREDGYIKAGIVPFHGHAKFTDPTTIKVEGQNNNNTRNRNNIILTGKHIVIATGAIPVKLTIPGSENIITSDQFLELPNDRLPERIVFVGGGYISFEFAHVAARAGAKVTILHHGKRPLEHFDPDLVSQLVQRSKDIGIDIRLQAEVNRVDRSFYSHDNSRLVVHYSSYVTEDGKGKTSSRSLEADMVVHGAGRVPNLEELNLVAGKVKYTSRGIQVNEYLQSVSNPAVYAAGDVAASGGAPLTPAASYDGTLVANNLLKGNTMKSNYTGLPSVVFTIPPLAATGVQEKEAKDIGLRFRTVYRNTNGWASSKRVGETCSGFKLLIEEGTDRILGAHMIGPHAEEVINIFSIAIRSGLTAKTLNDPILYSYPTSSSDVVYMLSK
jgi:glutathione reductase (NADPH)